MIDDAELKRRLTPEQYRITRCAGTERAFTGPYWNEKRSGLYACVACGAPLFRSETKYDSGSGWPSFHTPVAAETIAELRDISHGMVRTEIRCAACESHLGHVFDDGPAPTGLRYCVNGNALALHPDDSETE
ncbi:MAG: peptide-methionine (R)-S-oxide reductase MsrB [Siculibacillus sp.]|nr:peptide-methionine (R)-S-oxide reductase MsrB [Siculibacillus sp.]